MSRHQDHWISLNHPKTFSCNDSTVTFRRHFMHLSTQPWPRRCCGFCWAYATRFAMPSKKPSVDLTFNPAIRLSGGFIDSASPSHLIDYVDFAIRLDTYVSSLNHFPSNLQLARHRCIRNRWLVVTSSSVRRPHTKHYINYIAVSIKCVSVVNKSLL